MTMPLSFRLLAQEPELIAPALYLNTPVFLDVKEMVIATDNVVSLVFYGPLNQHVIVRVSLHKRRTTIQSIKL